MTIDLDMFSTLRARCEKSAAERDAAVTIIRLLLVLVSANEFRPHDEQVVMRRARAFLAEQGI